MPSIIPQTSVVFKDEPCLALVEVVITGGPGMGLRRVQVIYVVRDDAMAEHRIDLGPAKQFNAPPLRIPAFGEHTVAELQDIAEKSRLVDDYWSKRMVEIRDASTLITDFYDQLEEAKKRIGNRTTSGPLLTIQRNGIDKKAVLSL